MPGGGGAPPTSNCYLLKRTAQRVGCTVQTHLMCIHTRPYTLSHAWRVGKRRSMKGRDDWGVDSFSICHRTPAPPFHVGKNRALDTHPPLCCACQISQRVATKVKQPDYRERPWQFYIHIRGRPTMISQHQYR